MCITLRPTQLATRTFHHGSKLGMSGYRKRSKSKLRYEGDTMRPMRRRKGWNDDVFAEPQVDQLYRVLRTTNDFASAVAILLLATKE